MHVIGHQTSQVFARFEVEKSDDNIAEEVTGRGVSMEGKWCVRGMWARSWLTSDSSRKRRT